MNFNEADSRIYPELLKAGHEICITPQGKSMFPLLDGHKDSVYIKPKSGKIKANDLILYKNKEGKLVVHRVFKVKPTGYVLLGDGNIEKEFPICENDIYGICTAVKRKGKTFSVDALGYGIYVIIWKFLYPVRRYLLKLFNIA